VRAIALVAIVAGILVLAGALAAEHERRIQESVVLKVLGATRTRIMGIFLCEFSLIGVVTAVIAAIVATGAAWVVITKIMEAEWVFFPQTLVITLAIALTIMLIAGFLSTFRALSTKTAPYLRND
ncbi:MAG: FtsX-like permease family protein, partial [Pseudomonadota bacterium]